MSRPLAIEKFRLNLTEENSRSVHNTSNSLTPSFNNSFLEIEPISLKLVVDNMSIPISAFLESSPFSLISSKTFSLPIFFNLSTDSISEES